LEYLADIWLSCVSISSTLARTPDNVWADVVVKVCAIGSVLARGKCKEWCLLRDQSIAVVAQYSKWLMLIFISPENN